MDDKIKEIMADILGIQEHELCDEFAPNDASAWDSLNNLRLITALEEAFSIKLTMKNIREMNNYRAIRETIARHLEQN